MSTVSRGPYRKSYLVPHGRGWKYVKAVPKALQRIEGKIQWRAYLGVVSRAEAEIEAHKLAAQHGNRILTLNAMTADEREALVHARAEARQLEMLAAIAHPESLRLPAKSDDKATAERVRKRAAGIRLGIADTLKRAGELRRLADRADGRNSYLMKLVDNWVSVRQPRSYKSIEKTKMCMSRFLALVGDIKPREVTRSHAVQFRDHLKAKGYSASNASQHLDKLHTVFNVALGSELVDTNPFHKVKAYKENKPYSEGRQGFSGDQVEAIVTALDSETEDFAWAVKLLIYHGARSGEVAQLKVGDVAKLHGIDVLRIHDRHGRVKNKFSVRDVPLHPKCAEIIAYARAVEQEHGADAWLFQTFEAQKQGRAHKFQTYFGRSFLRTRKVDIKDSRYTLHSLRHSFRTACREASVPEAVSRALMGHSMGGGEHGAYGTVPSMKLRAKWIAKVDPLKG